MNDEWRAVQGTTLSTVELSALLKWLEVNCDYGGDIAYMDLLRYLESIGKVERQHKAAATVPPRYS